MLFSRGSFVRICFINPTVEMRRPIAELATILADRHRVTVVWPRLRKDSVADIFHFSHLEKKNLEVMEIPCIQPRGEYSFPIPSYPGFPGDMASLVREQDIIHIWTYFYPLTNMPLLMKKLMCRGNGVGSSKGNRNCNVKRNGNGNRSSKGNRNRNVKRNGKGNGNGSRKISDMLHTKNSGGSSDRQGKTGNLKGKVNLNPAKIVLTSDTFPSFSFHTGGLTDHLMRYYARIFGHGLFSIPDRVAIYGDSMRPFAREAGVPEDRTIVLPSGVHTGKFTGAKPNGIREELRMDPDEKLILFAGMIAPRKGIDVALGTAAILRRKGTRFRMLFCGRGIKMSGYKRMARRMGIDGVVHFAGARRDVPELMKSSDILFLPSRGEGLPGVVMEAAAAGLPVVASRIPCIPDLVEHGRTGLMSEMDDSRGFASNLSKLLEDDELRHEMGQRAGEKIGEWDWQHIVPRYESLYRQLLDG